MYTAFEVAQIMVLRKERWALFIRLKDIAGCGETEEWRRSTRRMDKINSDLFKLTNNPAYDV